MPKLYFRKDDPDRCYPKGVILEMMVEEGIAEIEVEGANRETGTDYFFCKEFVEVGEKGNCGRQCDGYEPRNGKSGCCRHFGFCYVPDGNKITLKIDL